jgi:hypothetical protein
MKNIGYIVGYIVVFIVIVSVSYGIYALQRNVNYTMSYESMVQETVCDMVRPEALKNPENCVN